jgi:formylglycine-generating enzyme
MSHPPDPIPDPEDEADLPANHAVPAWKIGVIAAVALVGIVLGSMLALNRSDKDLRLRGKPAGALGHDVVISHPVGMVWIAGQNFTVGTDEGPADERPAHKVGVRGFWIDRHEVTNDEFSRFVEATGYRTLAEESGTNGATWRTPGGAGSSVEGRGDQPVVWLAWNDALSYAVWIGKRLPSEAEWEFAAQGAIFKPAAGPFGGPVSVDSVPTDRNGLQGMDGNVREWCHDAYDPGFYGVSPEQSPSGPDDYGNISGDIERVIRGGSHRGERLHAPAGTGLPDVGFRLVKNGPPFGPSR